jgi:hypothetical protein
MTPDKQSMVVLAAGAAFLGLAIASGLTKEKAVSLLADVRFVDHDETIREEAGQLWNDQAKNDLD